MAALNPYIISGNDIHYYRVTGALANRFYTMPVEGNALTTLALSSLNIYAIPFIVPKTITLNRIAVNVTAAGAAGTKILLGIYIDNGNVYPGAMILNAGSVPADAIAVQTIVINQQLNKNTLYWLVITSDGTPTVRAATSAPIIPILGFPSNLPTTPGMAYVTFILQLVLPDPFPVGILPFSGTVPLVFVRLSS